MSETTSFEVSKSTAEWIDTLFPGVRGRENKVHLLVARLKEQDKEIEFLRKMLEGMVEAHKK